MTEIEKFHNLLILVEQLGDPKSNVFQKDMTLLGVSNDEDVEAVEWASLIVGAGGKLMQEARLRTCRSGLKAVNCYMSDREAV